MSRKPVVPLSVESIISQHADEVAFAWDLRSRAVSSTIYKLSDLIILDERIEANVDGLRIAGEAGWRAVRDQLSFTGGGELFAAGVMAVDAASVDRFAEAIEAIEAAGDPTASLNPVGGLISSVGWFPFLKVRHQLEVCLKSASAIAVTVGIGGAAIHRQDPGTALDRALDSDHLPLRRRALKAVGELRRLDLGNQLQGPESDEACRFYRARSLALIGWKTAQNELRSIAVDGGSFAERAVDLAVRTSDSQDARSWLAELSSAAELSRIAAKGAGALGDPAVVKWLIEQMDLPENARAAGEAFATITGLDLADAELEADVPDGFEAGPNDDPDDEDVEMDSDEDLPWPSPELIEQWWAGSRDRFTNGQRYFLGKPASQSTWREALTAASQWHRRSAAIELALADPKSVLFEVRAPGLRQLASLKSPKNTNHE